MSYNSGVNFGGGGAVISEYPQGRGVVRQTFSKGAGYFL